MWLQPVLSSTSLAQLGQVCQPSLRASSLVCSIASSFAQSVNFKIRQLVYRPATRMKMWGSCSPPLCPACLHSRHVSTLHLGHVPMLPNLLS